MFDSHKVPQGTEFEGCFESQEGISTNFSCIPSIVDCCLLSVGLVALFFRACDWLPAPSHSPAAQSSSQMLWDASVPGSVTVRGKNTSP